MGAEWFGRRTVSNCSARVSQADSKSKQAFWFIRQFDVCTERELFSLSKLNQAGFRVGASARLAEQAVSSNPVDLI